MSKGDLSQAFRLIWVCVRNLRFLGFALNGLFYFDKMLPMGAAVSCSQFDVLSRVIHWILTNVFKVPYMSHILDIFLFFATRGLMSLW